MLSNEDLDKHMKRVKGAKADIMAQIVGYKNSTGDVQASYKKVILDKLWKLSQMNGEFYHKFLAATAELEARFLEEVPLGGGRYALPQIEKMLETQNQTSDTPVAVLRSVPSFPHPPSFQ